MPSALTSSCLTGDRRAAFVEQRDLVVWNDHSETRDDRATEHAAEIIAWGLDQRCKTDDIIGGEAYESLAAAFGFLTGTAPICQP